MKNKLKERLIKLSYNFHFLLVVGIVITILTPCFVVLAIIFKSNRNILLNVAISLPVMCNAFVVSLKTIREYDCQGEIIYKNKFRTLLLANTECVREYIFVIAIVVPILLNNCIGYTLAIVALIGFIIMPKRISRHYKEKIIK